MMHASERSELRARTCGVILAGGEARRLGGVRKAELRLGGERLIDGAVAIAQRQCAKVLICSGKSPGNPKMRNVTALPDPGNGPAAALLHAASAINDQHANIDFLMLMPCDAPFTPADFTNKAAHAMKNDTACVIGRFQDQDYPTHALWHLEALLELTQRFKSTNGLSLFALVDQVDWQTAHFAEADNSNPFFNINTPDDLIKAGRMRANNPVSFS